MVEGASSEAVLEAIKSHLRTSRQVSIAGTVGELACSHAREALGSATADISWHEPSAG
jgi:hypothetical protein